MRREILAACIVAACMGVGAGAALGQQVDAGQQVLDSARRAYNEGKYPFAADRFREFVKANPNHKELAGAELGLGAALLEAAEPDYAGAVEALTVAAGKQDYEQRGQALYYLGMALKGQAGQMADRAKGAVKLEEAVKRLAEATAVLDKQSEKVKVAAGAELPLEVDLAARARAEWADGLLQAGKFEQSAEVARGLADSPRLAKSAYRGLGLYEQGNALFRQKDLQGAGRALAQLAPFGQDYGPNARYLLARIHQLSNELPEAANQYKALLEGFEQQKAAAREALKDDKLSAARRKFLEGIASGAQPEYIVRAGFYYATILGDSGQGADAIVRLKALVEANLKSPLAAEAMLRIGLLQVQAKTYAEALKTLEPLRENKPFGDQAWWFSARAAVALADPANPAALEQAQRGALDMYARAAGLAAELAKTGDGEAALRRANILVERADLQITLKQYKEAAATCAGVAAEFAAVAPAAGKVQEALERQVIALQLGGQWAEADGLSQKFAASYPKSLLLPSVLLRGAESEYLAALAATSDAKKAAEVERMLAEAIKRYQRVVTDFPDFGQVNIARQGMANAQYRQGKYAEAAETLKGIAESERGGDLLVVWYLQGDCLLRTLPPEGDDALATAKMLLQAEAAAKNLNMFVTTAGPKAPLGADALFKFGYCQQRIGMVLADLRERRKSLQQARDAYEKVLATVPWDNPLAAAATLERGKTLALLGDVSGAEKELRRFTADPLNKAFNAPLAVLRLGSLLRSQGRAQEAADVLKQWRDLQEAALVKDAGRADWVPLLQYEYGLALKEAGKFEEARAVFETLVKGPAGAAGQARVEPANVQWRAAQCRREQLAVALASARAAVGGATRPEEIDAAAKALDGALRGMLEWVYVTAPAEELARKNGGGEGAVRMSYELAWGYRVLGEAQVEAARAKMQRDQLQTVLLKSREKPAAGFDAGAGLHPAEVGDAAIGLQTMEVKAREAMRKVIVGADAAGLALGSIARVDLGEMLAARGKTDEALDLLTEALEKDPSVETADRARVRIAACLLAKGKAKGAFEQCQVVLKNNSSRAIAEARYLAGEACMAQKDLPKAIDFLLVFRSDGRYLNAGEVADKALLRLSYALNEAGRFEEGRQAALALLQKYPQSAYADEARFNIGWALQSAKRLDEATTAYTEVTRRTASETAARAQLQIGLVRVEQRNFADAAKAFLVVPYTYDYAELAAPAWYQAGLAYLELKQPAEAKSAFERLVKEHPQSRYVAAAQQKLAEIR